MGSEAQPQERVIPVRPNDKEKIALFTNYDGFLFDLDGTLWKGNTLIPGAVEVLELLRAQGKKVYFVTNNATKSRSAVLKKMTIMGLTAYEDEILCSAYAAAVYAKGKKIQRAYVIGEEGLVDELKEAGVSVLGGPADRDKAFDWGVAAAGSKSSGGAAAKDPELALDPAVTAVFVGLDRYINYYKLQMAMSYILVNKAEFVACNTDARGNLASTSEWCGAGTMVAAVIGCSEAEPTVVGKPNSLMMDIISRNSGITRNKLCVVGDRLDTDIAWAERCGAGSLVVLTGSTSEEQLLSPENKIKAPFYVDTIGDLLTVKDQLSTWGSCTIC